MEHKVDTVIGAYVRLRDDLKKLKDEHKAKEDVLKLKMEKLETWLLRYSEETGLSTLAGDMGTAYRKTKDMVAVKDRDAFFTWIKENDMYSMLTASASKDAVKEFMKENGGELPPGLSYSSQFVINVNRPRKKKEA